MTLCLDKPLCFNLRSTLRTHQRRWPFSPKETQYGWSWSVTSTNIQTIHVWRNFDGNYGNTEREISTSETSMDFDSFGRTGLQHLKKFKTDFLFPESILRWYASTVSQLKAFFVFLLTWKKWIASSAGLINGKWCCAVTATRQLRF